MVNTALFPARERVTAAAELSIVMVMFPVEPTVNVLIIVPAEMVGCLVGAGSKTTSSADVGTAFSFQLAAVAQAVDVPPFQVLVAEKAVVLISVRQTLAATNERINFFAQISALI